MSLAPALKQFFSKQQFLAERCHTISVVIPTLNEEKSIGQCVSESLRSPHVCEVIVADGGSDDRTTTIALKAGAKVVVHDRPYSCGGGRGGQIKAGVESTAGDVVVILHADTTILPKIFRRIIDVLNARPSVIGGSVGCRFKPVSGGKKVGKDGEQPHSRQFKLGIIEFLNDARAALFKISFGDQVQFFRRSPVVHHNLFPNMPLMEDVEFSIRLNSFGQQVFLFGRAMVSARRWERVGSKNSVIILWLFVSYIIKRFINRSGEPPDTAPFYKEYYHKGYL